MKKRTIAQQAGSIRTKLKRQGIEKLKYHDGSEIPLSIIPNHKLIEHFIVMDHMQRARQLKAQLEELKFDLQTQGDEIYTQLLKEEGLDAGDIKNFTLFSLDKNERIVFKRPPGYTINEAERKICLEFKKKWLDDVAENLTDEVRYLVELVDQMLETRNGEIDPGSVATLNQWVQKIRNPHFRKMVDHLNKSREAYYKKRYEQFIEKDGQGEDETIVLTYAKVKPVPLEPNS